MSDQYRVDLEVKKKIRTKEDFIKFYKKILLLNDFVDEINFEYYEEDEWDEISGTLLLNKNKFKSLYKTAAEIKWGHNSDFYQNQAKNYHINFEMPRWKKSNKIDIVIEDISEEFYSHHYPYAISILPCYLAWIKNGKVVWRVPWRKILIALSQPKFLRNVREIKLPLPLIDKSFLTIIFSPFKKINKYVRENNRIFIEFIMKVIDLYDVDKCIGRHYNDTSDDGTLIFEYSKKTGFKIHHETL